MRVDDIIERFRTNTQLRIRKTSSREAYELTFRRFAAYASGKRIEAGRKSERVSSIPFSREQLRGPKGKELLMGYISTVGDFSKRTAIAHLKKFWRKGMSLDWPLDLDDIGKLPEVRAEGVPSDESVRPWFDALDLEPNIAVRSLMRTQLTY